VVAERRRREWTEGQDLLSALLAPAEGGGAGFSDRELCDQLVTFLIAGSETTAVALAWAVHFLAADRELQRRVQAEVDGLGLDGRAIGGADLARLPLIRNTVIEALRYYPPGWLFSRVTTRATVLGGQAVPAGRTLLYSPYLVHHRPELYPDPERFDPDRWGAEARHRPPRSAFLAFGAGARSCIGEQFGLAEAVLVLATLVAHWEWTELAESDARPVAGVSLRPKRLRVRPTARVRGVVPAVRP
jgi:pentalenene oxygenase